MKTIYTAELNAKLPVIVYVSPDGSRAASAGVWISEAARRPRNGADDEHRLVDADRLERSEPRLRPATQGDQRRCRVASRHSQQRITATPPGRRTPCAIASNLTADQALKMHVIDVVAPTLPALLTKLDGYKTKDAERPYTLHLAGAHIDTVKPGLLHAPAERIIDPNHPQPALPRRHRRHRLRGAPSRHRASGRARRGVRSSSRCSASRCSRARGRDRADRCSASRCS